MPSAAGGCDGDLEAACTTLVDVLMDFCQRLGTLVPRGMCFSFGSSKNDFISLGPHIWTYLITSLNLRNEGKLLVSSFSLSASPDQQNVRIKGPGRWWAQCRRTVQEVPVWTGCHERQAFPVLSGLCRLWVSDHGLFSLIVLLVEDICCVQVVCGVILLWF